MDIESELMGTEREAGEGLADANWHIQDRKTTGSSVKHRKLYSIYCNKL